MEVIELKDDKSKGSVLRRAGALTILGELIKYYDIPVARGLFINSINSKNKNEQYAALEGLANYFAFSEDEAEDDLVEMLNDLKDQTDDRSVAYACLEVQASAGIIDEVTAMFRLDDWKDEHHY